MHTIEPFYMWLNLYNAAEDKYSPFYGREYNEFQFTNTVYNYFIHPQWDEFGSATLYIKILYTDYDQGFAIIELMGEWNDCLYNDIMYLKEEVIDVLMKSGISKFILIGENVFNFHYSDDCYYQEWFDDIEGGWILAINFRQHVIDEFKKCMIHHYISFLTPEIAIDWRKYTPDILFAQADALYQRKLPEVNE
jgi:hypothetical protein